MWRFLQKHSRSAENAAKRNWLHDFRSGQTIASIGGQCCHWEAPYSVINDSVIFYKKSYLNGTKFLLMPQNTYRSLPLESLYELLSSSVRDMLSALDTKQDNLIAYKALRKQVELLLEVIDEKRQGTTPTNATKN